MLSVARHHAAALLDLSIQMPQVAKSHRRLEFIHLGVGADRVHNDLIADSEILKTVQILLQSVLLSVKAYSVWNTFVAWKLNMDASPNVATPRPLYVTPNVCAAS